MNQQNFLIFSKFLEIQKEGPNLLGGTNSVEPLNYLVLTSLFQFEKVERHNFFVIH